jgi:hypothetical protein
VRNDPAANAASTRSVIASPVLARRAYPQLLTLSASAAALGGCLLFTGHINSAPSVTVMGPSTSLKKNVAAEFTAQASDPDQSVDSLEFEWRQGRECPAALEQAHGGELVIGGIRKTTVEVTPDKTGPLCVWVIVRDADGATAFGVRMSNVDPGMPTASIEVTKSKTWTKDLYVLYSDVRLSGAKSKGSISDAPTLSWTLARPSGAAAPAPACTDSPKDVCFTADSPGAYTVALTVTDPQDSAMNIARDMKVLMVDEDRPPCIDQTTPAYSSVALPILVWTLGKTGSIDVHAVSDDGDPFPDETGQSQSTLVWEYRKVPNPTWERFPRPHLAQLPFPLGEVAPDDIVFVRLRYYDRIDRDFSKCDPEANCQLPSAPVRPQPCYQQVAWKFRML